jgi:hypothetical protein
MDVDRTARRTPTTGIGLMPRRALIKRKGAGDPRSKILGLSLMVIAVMVFVSGLQTERVTFDFDATEVESRWNAAAPLDLSIEPIVPREDDAGDLVFGYEWAEAFSLRGRIDPDTGNVVELSVIGKPDAVGGERMIEAMTVLVEITEPDLTSEQRDGTLQELGVIGGDPTADLRATRNQTDYVVAASNDGTTVGMSAAPYSRVTSQQ